MMHSANTMVRQIGRWLAGLLLLGNAGVAMAAVAVVDLPVSFQVENRNPTLDACLVDGKSYTIHGHLIGPASALAATVPGALTMYLHGIGWGSYYWHYTADPSYDYATLMAQAGHVSLVYDQIGYGDSGRPAGLLSCYGGEANIAHQMITALRAGSYAVDGRATPPKFSRVALASQQAAGLIAEPEAYSFRDIDALIITSLVDVPAAFKPAFALGSAPFFAACALGGQRSDGATGPYFYEPFPPTDASFVKLSFANADPAVIATATALRGRSPCGEASSAFQTLGLDAAQLLLRSVKVPVLIVEGMNDALFLQPLGGMLEKALFAGSNDVNAVFIANAGQALALERTAGDFRTALHRWLLARGF